MKLSFLLTFLYCCLALNTTAAVPNPPSSKILFLCYTDDTINTGCENAAHLLRAASYQVTIVYDLRADQVLRRMQQELGLPFPSNLPIFIFGHGVVRDGWHVLTVAGLRVERTDQLIFTLNELLSNPLIWVESCFAGAALPRDIHSTYRSYGLGFSGYSGYRDEGCFFTDKISKIGLGLRKIINLLVDPYLVGTVDMNLNGVYEPCEIASYLADEWDTWLLGSTLSFPPLTPSREVAQALVDRCITGVNTKGAEAMALMCGRHLKNTAAVQQKGNLFEATGEATVEVPTQTRAMDKARQHPVVNTYWLPVPPLPGLR